MAAFASVDELKDHLRDQGLDTAAAQLYLDAIAAEIRETCGWSITEEIGVVATLDGPGDPDLLLPTLQLTAVTSVVEDGVTLAAPADYLVYRDKGKLTRVANGEPIDWTDRLQGVVVIFAHGYAALAVPGVFKTITLEAAGRVYDNPGGGLKSRTVGRVAVSYADAKAAVGPIDDPRLDYYRLPEGF